MGRYFGFKRLRSKWVAELGQIKTENKKQYHDQDTMCYLASAYALALVLLFFPFAGQDSVYYK